jgi:hypothetical protein
MPSPEKMCAINKVISETKKEGAIASIKSFGLDILGIAAGAAGIGVGFLGFGGEVAITGRIIGFLALTMAGTYAFVKSESSMRKADSAFKQVKEIKLSIGKQALGEHNAAQ